jgi:hypothetical protein
MFSSRRDSETRPRWLWLAACVVGLDVSVGETVLSRPRMRNQYSPSWNLVSSAWGDHTMTRGRRLGCVSSLPDTSLTCCLVTERQWLNCTNCSAGSIHILNVFFTILHTSFIFTFVYYWYKAIVAKQFALMASRNTEPLYFDKCSPHRKALK